MKTGKRQKTSCETCKSWGRLGEWWGRCSNEHRTAIETDDPGAGPEMTRKTFTCSVWIPPNAESETSVGSHDLL
jgi:hypothetical protein